MARMATDDPFRVAWGNDRPYLVDLAFRMLGDLGRAEDTVQEAFWRLSQARIDEIDDPRGWLIVVTSRLCLDDIKSARSRRELASDSGDIDRQNRGPAVDPADRVTLDDHLREALMVVLEALSPAERVVFVLHDVFQTPFDQIAETVGRTSASCRQLARRARLKVESFAPLHGAEHRALTEAFIDACAGGDIDALLHILDPDVTGTIDTFSQLVVTGSSRVAHNLLRYWSGPGHTLVSYPVGSQPALLGFAGRELTGIVLLDLDEGRVTKIHVMAQPEKLDFVRSQLALVSTAG